MFIYYLIILNEYFTAAHLCRVAPVGKEMRGCVDRRIHTFQLQKATAAKRGEHTWQRFLVGRLLPVRSSALRRASAGRRNTQEGRNKKRKKGT